MADVLPDRRPDVVPYRATMCGHGFLVSFGATCPLCRADEDRDLRRWPPDLEYSLAQLYSRGEAVPAIAAKLGKSVKSVETKIDRMRLARILPER